MQSYKSMNSFKIDWKWHLRLRDFNEKLLEKADIRQKQKSGVCKWCEMPGAAWSYFGFGKMEKAQSTQCEVQMSKCKCHMLKTHYQSGITNHEPRRSFCLCYAQTAIEHKLRLLHLDADFVSIAKVFRLICTHTKPPVHGAPWAAFMPTLFCQ